jgi:hypothetical protein
VVVVKTEMVVMKVVVMAVMVVLQGGVDGCGDKRWWCGGGDERWW